MESYVVSARKYRPATFKSVVGQHALVNTLRNAVKSGRLAHSYLFCGQRGVGKTTTARIFAKAINCEHLTADGDPCNECESCRAFNEQRSLNIIELDAASNNSVDDIRQLTDQVLVPPVTGRYRVFIVDEVHMLSTAAFNAFLKTLEEPPSYVVFILATTERQKIMPTILSRCQKYDFQRITPSDIAEQLKYVADCEGYTTEPAALNVIAQKADGAMRDALSIFDQVAASSMGNITYNATIDNLNILDYEYYFRLVDAFIEGSVEKSLILYKEIRDHGFDSKVFVNGLASHLRELVMAHSAELLPLMEVTADIVERYRKQSAACTLNRLYAALDLCNTCDLTYNEATGKRLLVELTLIKICQLFTAVSASTQQQSTTQPIQKIAKSIASNPSALSSPQPASQPAMQRPVTSSPQPAPRPAPQPMPGRSGATRGSVMGTISIKNTLASAEKSTDEKKNDAPIASTSPRATAYTDDAFKEAWYAFVRENPSEVILVNTMKSIIPQRVDGDNYMIELDNPSQLNNMQERLGMITNWLHDKLQNDNVTINLAVRKKDSNEKVWNAHDLLEDVVKRRPEALETITQFKLKLE